MGDKTHNPFGGFTNPKCCNPPIFDMAAALKDDNGFGRMYFLFFDLQKKTKKHVHYHYPKINDLREVVVTMVAKWVLENPFDLQNIGRRWMYVLVKIQIIERLARLQWTLKGNFVCVCVCVVKSTLNGERNC